MKHQYSTALPGDRLGRAIAGRLSEGGLALDHDIVERLRVARQQALAARRAAAQAATPAIAPQSTPSCS